MPIIQTFAGNHYPTTWRSCYVAFCIKEAGMTAYDPQYPWEPIPMVTQERLDKVRAWLRKEEEATDLFFDNYFRKRPGAHFFEAVDAWRADLGYKPKPNDSFLHKEIEKRIFIREYWRKYPNSIVGDGDHALSKYFGDISRSYATPDLAILSPEHPPEIKDTKMDLASGQFIEKETDQFFDEYYRQRPNASFNEVVDSWRDSLGEPPKPIHCYFDHFLDRNDDPRRPLFRREFYRRYPSANADDVQRALDSYRYGSPKTSFIKIVSKQEASQTICEVAIPNPKKEAEKLLDEQPRVVKLLPNLPDPVNVVAEIAKRENWQSKHFCYMGSFYKIDRPRYADQWAFYPEKKFPRPIPREAYQHLEVVKRDGRVKIEQVLVMDDPRKHPIPSNLLPPPDPHTKIKLPKVKWGFVFGTTAKIIGGTIVAVPALAVGAVVVAAAAAVAVAGAVIVGAGALLAYDPELAILTTSNDLIVIYSWND